MRWPKFLTYLVFIQFLARYLPKPWNFWNRVIKVLCVVWRWLLEAKDRCWLPGEPTLWLQDWTFSSQAPYSPPLPHLWGGTVLLQAESLPSSQWFNESCICNVSIEPKGQGWEIPSWWPCENSGTVLVERSWKLHTPSPCIALCISSIWMFPELYPYDKPVI